MAVGRIEGVRIAGIASAVPSGRRAATEDAARFGAEAVEKIANTTGIHSRRVVSPTTTAADLCTAAAERLLTELGWARESIELVVFVSQTPDYVLPATACVLQERLGLPRTTAAFDVNLGCSAYPYGLWTVGSLLASGPKRALLLVGDTLSRVVSPEDRAVALLFGDVGTATALERDPSAPPMAFDLGTDGRGRPHLIVPAGGFRQPRSGKTGERTLREGGNVRSEDDLYLDGAEVFTFTLREVPGTVRGVLAARAWEPDQVDAWVMHQANQFMVQHLAKRLKLPPDRVVYAIDEFGNTGGGSIPLAICSRLSARAAAGPLRLGLVGFGVGWSWAAAAVELGPALVLPPIEVPS